jgi:hypothetical protein
MTKQYFVLGTPGTATTFLAHLVRCYVDEGSSYPALVNQFEFSTPPGDIITPDFYYENLEINNNLVNIFSLATRPNIEKLRIRFPSSKIIIITHTLDEIAYIANYYYKAFFCDVYDAGADIHFKEILTTHSHLFSNVDASPFELSAKEEETFKKILQYQKLIDGFHNINELDSENLIKISFSDIIFRPVVLEKLSNFLGKESPTSAVSFYQETVPQLLKKFSPNNK